jgi:hypothetical protein
VVKLEAREVAYHGSHAVLYIKEVGFDVGVDEALEQRTIKQGEVAIRTKTSRWQLIGIAYQQHLLHSTLQSYQQICFSGLSRLVNNHANDPTSSSQSCSELSIRSMPLLKNQLRFGCNICEHSPSSYF